ncbi:AAA family ATPase [Actinomycetospora rhizophila]|uniref:AAA family ATPase n=1 Tax=Actinomycetospora rhizophila TaxID=1416876 RepID=A0ABV9ZAD8_9PSEU
MIQLGKLSIREFRGIRNLTLELGRKPFVVWGPNGSGKSGVVDAIDFALTGDVTRLRGKGSAGVSLTKHGPHVHKRNDPAAAEVELEVTSTGSGKTATLRRSVRSPLTFHLEPEIPEVRNAIEQAASHPEITLSRREIIKYVASEAGQRAKEVQALLKLERLENQRSTYRTALTRIDNATKSAADSRDTARNALKRQLDVAQLTGDEILESVNLRRRTLILDEFTTFDASTDVSQGVDQSATSSFDKGGSLRDIEALTTSIATLRENGVEGQSEIVELLHTIDSDPELLDAIKHQDFWTSGLALVVDASCPLCDHQWNDAESLRAHIEHKLSRAAHAKEVRTSILTHARKLQSRLNGLAGEVASVQRHAVHLGDADLGAQLAAWEQALRTTSNALTSLDKIRENAEASVLADVSQGNAIELFAEAVRSRPDQSAQVTAQKFLIVAQDRLRASRQEAANHKLAEKASAAAKALYDSYVSAVEDGLKSLYDSVEADLSSFYQKLNSDDEAAFKAELTPSGGKLNMAVDFYGLGMFPPTAYHSEGHQDGMGVCLYLALMRHLLGPEFRLAVLDDVVMSVDSEHRRQFCTLLKEQFPNVQFIVTTHDTVWARQMMAAGVMQRTSQARFFGWSVDGGPIVEHAADFWKLVDDDLAKDAVPDAAARLRRNLESTLSDVAEGLGAKVVYNPTGKYDFGDLASGVRERFRELLKKAKKSAESWGQTDRVAAIEQMDSKRKEIESELGPEGWVVNPAVHYTSWADLSAADFAPVVAAYKKFLGQFECSNAGCGSWLYVSGSKTSPDSLRCGCSAVSLNLQPKSSASN